MAIAFVMALCLFLYKLAEVRVRQGLTQTEQTVPDQVLALLGPSYEALYQSTH